MESKKWNFKKALIITFGGIIGLLLLLGIIGFWGLKPLLSKRIKIAVLQTTDSLYHLDFKDIKYEIMTGNAHVLGVTWGADSTLYEGLRQAKKMPDNIYQGKVNDIELTGLRPWTIIFSSKLNLKIINIKDPVIEVIHEKQPYNSFKNSKSPYQIISKFVKSFSVEKVNFEHIRFTYYNHSKAAKNGISSIENLDLTVSDVLIDSVSDKDKERFYYTKECIFSLKNIEFPSEDSFNTLKIRALNFSTKTRSLSVKHLICQPRYKEMEYGNRTNGDDRIGMICKDIKLEGINVQKLFEEKKIYARRLQINHGKIHIFTDTRLFNTPKEANYRPFPHEAFRKWGVKFMIEEVKMHDFDITYSEYNPETGLTGNVIFGAVKGNVNNLTNDTIPLQNNPNCLVVLRAKLMNKADVSVKFNFNIAAPEGAFSCSGKVVNIEMAAVNQVTETLVKAKAETGFVTDFLFDMKGNKYGLSGSTTILYQDLTVAFLKNPTQNGEFKKKKLLSFLANTFMIKNGNPVGKRPVRIAKIRYRRIPSKPFFYTCWKGLLQGIIGSLM